MRLGKHQLCLLASMASPFSLLIVGDKVSRSLLRCGLLGPHFGNDGLFSITPAGLRALAAAMEGDKLEQFYAPEFRRDTARLYFDAKVSA